MRQKTEIINQVKLYGLLVTVYGLLVTPELPLGSPGCSLLITGH